MLIVAGMDVAVGVLVAGSLVAEGLPTAGSLAFGLSFTLLGFVFAGVALVAAQVSENTRVVYGAAGAVLGASFVLRAVGDIGDGTLSWLSPIGWAQKARPFAGERWWPFLFLVVAAVVLVAVAAALLAPARPRRRARGTPRGHARTPHRGSRAPGAWPSVSNAGASWAGVRVCCSPASRTDRSPTASTSS